MRVPDMEQTKNDCSVLLDYTQLFVSSNGSFVDSESLCSCSSTVSNIKMLIFLHKFHYSQSCILAGVFKEPHRFLEKLLFC